MTWRTSRLRDKRRILAYLESDEVYAAYAIGDLEPGMFDQSSFAGAETDGRLRGLILHFRGLDVPALLLMGDPEGVGAILETELRPQRVYLTYRQEHELIAAAFYTWDEAVPMWRMVVRPEGFRPAGQKCTRLGTDHTHQLEQLYALGGADAFSPAQVQQGVFYGVLIDDDLVAAAGTHLVSKTYGIAAVGNVFVHPGYRRRGYGTAATSAVTAELQTLGARLVILNVAQDNTAAIHIYERLGFERYCPFFECPIATAIPRPADT